MGGSKTVPADLAARIEDAVNETTEVWEADSAAARARAQETWALLPDPKLEWAIYPDFMSSCFAAAAVEAGDLEQAEHWLTIGRQVHDDPSAAKVGTFDKMEGRIRFEQGDLDAAFAALQRARAALGSGAFADLSTECRRFFADRVAGRETKASVKSDRSRKRPPKEMTPEVQARIDELCEQAEAADDADDTARTIELFEQAYELLPEPKDSHADSVRVLASLGDVLYLDGRVEEAEGFFQQALQSPGGIENPFVWLRLGEIHFDLGDKRSAADELTSAFMLEGEEIFASEDPKYRALLKDVLLPEEKKD